MATATKVKERPISFSDEMVRALILGRKSQTRRLVNLDKLGFIPSWIGWLDDAEEGTGWYAQDVDSGQFEPAECWASAKMKCPYGKPGDRLWVREAFSNEPYPDGSPALVYRANFDVSDGFGSEVIDFKTGEFAPLVWQSAARMPRRLSRITLEIEDIRVERLGDISEADKIAEGATPERPFGTVWRRVHTKPGERFEDSPWVWAISFRRI